MVVRRSVSKTVRVLNGSSFFHRDLGFFLVTVLTLNLTLTFFLFFFGVVSSCPLRYSRLCASARVSAIASL